MRRWEDVIKMWWGCDEDMMKMWWRCDEDVMKIGWRCEEDVMKMWWRCVDKKMWWRCEDEKMWWRCEQMKMYSRPPLLEEPFAQTLSGKRYMRYWNIIWCYHMCFSSTKSNNIQQWSLPGNMAQMSVFLPSVLQESSKPIFTCSRNSYSGTGHVYRSFCDSSHGC